MKPKILKEELLFDGFLKIKKVDLEYQHGKESVFVENTKMQKKDAVAILVWNKDIKKFIFVKQYRYPIVDREEDNILEIPAGTIEEKEFPEKTAIREVEEEIGYKSKDIEKIMEFYTSSGCSTEKVHLFMCIVSNEDKISNGGGLKKEGEVVEIIELSIDEVYNQLDLTLIKDAKTIIALQEFKIRHLNSIIEMGKDEFNNSLKKIKDLETKNVLLQSRPNI